MGRYVTRIWSFHFILVVMMAFFSACAAQTTYPLIAKYTLTIENDLSLASNIAGMMALSSMAVSPFAGFITDRLNQKTILQVSSLLYAAVLVAHVFATSIPVLAVMRLLVGVFFSINSIASTAFSTNYIPKEKMAEGLGYAALANVVASAVGPGIGMELAQRYGYSTVFITAAVFALLCFAMVTFLPYEKTEAAEKRQIRLENLMALSYMDYILIACLFSIGNSLVTTYLALIAEERNIANIALFFTLYSIVMAVFRPVIGKLQDQKGIYVIMVPAIIMAALGVGIIGVAQSIYLMLIASVFKAIGQGSGSPSLQADLIKRLGNGKAGVAASSIMIGMSAGNALGPILSGLVIKHMGYRNLFVVFAVMSAVISYALLLFRYIKDRKAPH